jgi:hypothetical protein
MPKKNQPELRVRDVGWWCATNSLCGVLLLEIRTLGTTSRNVIYHLTHIQIGVCSFLVYTLRGAMKISKLDGK